MDFAQPISDHHPAFLDIRIPASLDVALRKTDVIAKLRASAANFTFRHDG